MEKQSIKTGNHILDIILNYYSSELQGEIEVKGKSTCPVEISDMDLCGIFSNIFQNAVEYLQKEMVNEEEKYLRLDITQGKSYTKYIIENSVGNVKNKIDISKTQKEDVKNHGFGIQNIQRMVEKNEGEFEVEVGENSFKAIVILKNKIN